MSAIATCSKSKKPCYPGTRWLASSMVSFSLTALPAALLPACEQPNGKTVPQESSLSSGGTTVGDYKGIDGINLNIARRILDPVARVNLNFSVTSFIRGGSDLAILLGQYSGEATRNDFRNGKPNTLNVMLWNMFATKLASEIGASCTQEPQPSKVLFYPYNSHFSSVLTRICAWPAPEAMSEQALLDLWLVIAQFDAPREEFEAFRDFVLDPASPLAQESKQNAVKHMVRAILLNPYFLLEH